MHGSIIPSYISAGRMKISPPLLWAGILRKSKSNANLKLLDFY